MPDRGHQSLPSVKPGNRVGLNEIRDVLADEGYSADQRKAWLREVLTALQEDGPGVPSEEKRRLIGEVKAAIDDLQDGKPMSDDVL